MAREIDLLIEAARPDRAVVEKETNILWSREDLLQAVALDEYDEPDALSGPPEGVFAVTSIYPGCMHLGIGAEDYSRFQVIGQTRHFFIFAKPSEVSVAATPTGASAALPAARK